MVYRAGMVEDPAEYRWSSYRINALGLKSALCTPHGEYLALGKSDEERLNAYRALFKAHVDRQLVREIGRAVDKGMALGSERFGV